MDDEKKLKQIEQGKRVEAARKHKGLSQSELANIIYCSQNNVSMIEKGKRGITSENVERIANACGVTIDYLLLQSEFMTRQEEVQTLVKQLQQEDRMWLDFIRYIASTNGCLMKPADKSAYRPGDVNSPYMIFEENGVTDVLSVREINDYIKEVERHSVLSLQIMMERSRRK